MMVESELIDHNQSMKYEILQEAMKDELGEIEKYKT